MHVLFPPQTPPFQDSIHNFMLTTTKLVFQLVCHSFMAVSSGEEEEVISFSLFGS